MMRRITMMSKILAVIIGISAVFGCSTTTTFHTEPREADVFINGNHCNVSPCIYHSRNGYPDRIRVQILADGYMPAEFFIDTEAPLYSYLLWGVGSIFFHEFSSEYFFELNPNQQTEKQLAKKERIERLSVKIVAEPSMVANLFEQCMYWQDLTSQDEWQQRFVNNAKTGDCALAKTTLENLTKHKLLDPQKLIKYLTPPLARALIRYTHMGEKLSLPWKKSFLCSTAAIAYAKRVGLGNSGHKNEAFKAQCPNEHRLLLSQ